MDVGDTVTLASDPSFRGTLVQMPRSVGRKKPRALIQSVHGEQWVELSDIRPTQEHIDST